MVESGKEFKVSTLNAMLDVYCMNGLPMGADLLFDSAHSVGVLPDSSTYKSVYKAYTKVNMKELVQKLLKIWTEMVLSPIRGSSWKLWELLSLHQQVQILPFLAKRRSI
ncbi:hypothetical protein P3X46_018429 [Hevea brasiliensis]|uniref:Pentatricopeptide repeat-containing protein n=1 Tax=Hevea brasiliensis TaxID=3981 RepID=A0ABQ9LQN9_HEVBR|nr:hypothetical protein P3X46_018429 [Hevea brasiliensis]